MIIELYFVRRADREKIDREIEILFNNKVNEGRLTMRVECFGLTILINVDVL